MGKISKNAVRIMKRLKQDGLHATFHVGCQVLKNRKQFLQHESPEYMKWIEENEQDIYKVTELAYNPRFSILVPVYNVKAELLEECIESVKKQTYKNWQLCLVDDCSTMPEVREKLKSYEGVDDICIAYRVENGHISRTTNDALQLADGEFIGLLDCDDILAPNALYEMAKKLNEDPGYDFIYSDEDNITEDGKKRYGAGFKPEWSPDLFWSMMYTNHFSVFRRSIAITIGGYRVGYEGSQDYDFVLRFTEHAKKIGHVDKVLYHWRAREESVAGNPESKMYAYEAAVRAKQDALERRGIKGHVEYLAQFYQSRVVFDVPDSQSLVSIIIPSKDHPQYLLRCLTSIVERSDYKNIEIVVVDNGSKPENKEQYRAICEKVNAIYHYEEMDFNFSKMCNIGARLANGEYFILLNDDTEVLSKDWIERLIGQAALSYAGAVGAKLYYPNEQRIQHCCIVNFPEGPGHYLCGAQDDGSNYQLQSAADCLAVTGACLAIKASKYWEVDGFDESFPVAYNDVDFCFKLYEAGYSNVVRGDVALVHYESISRGSDSREKEKQERLLRERKHLYEKHGSLYQRDPYFSKNRLDNMLLARMDVEKICKPKKFEQQLSVERLENNISFAFECMRLVRLKEICVSGHFYWRDYGHNNSNIVVCVFKNKETYYSYYLRRSYFATLEDAALYQGNVKMTGFSGVLELSELPDGEYELLIGVGKRSTTNMTYYNTGQRVTV